ncbi:lipopolysaccharide biosynthesis protein [Rhodoblastus sp.]|uniref:lipopolysaccharide biosynthesis protein n=1 Tax=Rhodoblastus sp. TaxID=1962975 RepID=UPI003F983E4B
MLIILTFVLNAGLNFLLGLCVAAPLGPGAYGRFSIAFMAATLMTTLVFDWLRLSATRYYTEQTRADAPRLRATLNAGYLAGAIFLATLAGAVLLLGRDFGMGREMVIATVVVAIANGFFEFFGALLRARFHNFGYSRLVILKNVLAFTTMVGVGYLFRDPALVMVMAATSALVASLALWRQTADPQSRMLQASRSQIAAYMRYGAPIVVANAFYQAVVLANRGFAATHLDFAAAGKLSLATDMTIRLILVAGAALDIFLFQTAVHRRATEGAEAGAAQVSRNSTIILAALTLLCLGYMADLPAFTALIAPKKFRDTFEPLSLILAPGVALFCIGQFCFNPIAQLEHRTGLTLIAAVAATALDLGLIWFGPFPKSVTTLAVIHSASLAAGFFLMIALTWPWRAYWPRIRDVATVALGGAASLAAMWPLRRIDPPVVALFLVALAGVATFGGVLYLLDLGGVIRPAAARILGLRARGGTDAQSLCPGGPR